MALVNQPFDAALNARIKQSYAQLIVTGCIIAGLCLYVICSLSGGK